jgi:hypothetical protein
MRRTCRSISAGTSVFVPFRVFRGSLSSYPPDPCDPWFSDSRKRDALNDSGPAAFRMARPTHRLLQQRSTRAGYLPGRKLYSPPGPGNAPSPIPHVAQPPDPHDSHAPHDSQGLHAVHGQRSRRQKAQEDPEPHVVQPLAPAVANARTTRSRSFFIVGISITKRNPWPRASG